MNEEESPELTQLVRAPAVRPPTRVWRPAQLHKLPRLSKRQAHLLGNVQWLTPNVSSNGELAATLEKRLTELLDERVAFRIESMQMVPAARLASFVGKTTFLAILAPLPQQSRGLLEVELGLAHRVIDLLLGGAGDTLALRPLTDIEEGVMTYVLIETLRTLTPSLEPALPALRVEGVARGLEEMHGLIAEDEDLAVVQWQVKVGTQSGYVRLSLPESILARAMPSTSAPVRSARLTGAALAHRDWVSHITTELRVEIGSVEISAGDLAGLRERDVLLIDSLTARPDLGEGGTGWLRAGLGRHASIAVEIGPVEGRFQATITGFHSGANAIQGSADVDEGHAENGAELMRDIPLQIAVEIGRVAVTADEVVSLAVGHVFDLNRASGEPVDLSVNGKHIARGELVEVDGNLGVRIISLA